MRWSIMDEIDEFDPQLKRVLEWDGTSWELFEDQLCTGRTLHTTILYGGAIYHMGKYR